MICFRRLSLFLLLLLAAACGGDSPAADTGGDAPSPGGAGAPVVDAGPRDFDGAAAYDTLLAQMALGPRYPGSDGHTAVRGYIVNTLTELGWDVENQDFDYQGFPARNIIARQNVGVGPIIIVGAHYDTRRIADQTPGSSEPVPGAVDGASGVSVLLELAAALDLADVPNEVWLAFFDVEDNGGGGIDGWDWIAGSRYMAENLTETPKAMVLADMVGDADQQLYYEGNSDPVLRATLWAIASELGYSEQFIPTLRHTMIDDHLPFVEKGIPAVDIIDFDYPHWHTVEDTADKVSADSLLRVGRVLETWLESGR